MMQVLSKISESKKFLAAVIATTLAVVLKVAQPELSVQQIFGLMSPLLAFIGAQGLADIGKEKAKIQAGAPARGYEADLQGKPVVADGGAK